MKPHIRFVLYLGILLLAALTPLPRIATEQSTFAAQTAKKVIQAAIVMPAAKKAPRKTLQPKPKPKPVAKAKQKPKPKQQNKPLPEPKPRSEPAAKPKSIALQETAEPEQNAVETAAVSTAKRDSAAQKKKRYYALVYAAIAANKRYPKKAIRFHQEGSVRVRFTVDGDGTITAFRIVAASGVRSLDKATRKLFEHLKKFQPPPEGTDLPLEMTINIKYTLGHLRKLPADLRGLLRHEVFFVFSADLAKAKSR